MDKPVDVLAVMERDAEHAAAYRLAHGSAGGSLMRPIYEASEARAAVAELIEASKGFLPRCGCCGGGTGVVTFVGVTFDCDAPSCVRLRAALRRVQGEA